LAAKYGEPPARQGVHIEQNNDHELPWKQVNTQSSHTQI